MPPWLSQIRIAQNIEFELPSSSWVQLASIGIDNSPRVRTVVFRGWSKSYEMEIYTDKRSQKNKEINLNNNVEICWLFSQAQCQFRLRGKARVDSGKDTFRHWEHLSGKSKSMWSWPTPGDRFISNQINDLSLKKGEDLIENFNLLKIYINNVDQLILDKPIHKRRRWILKKEWIEELINP